jgi:SNF2 family DNA or RNA helicase
MEPGTGKSAVAINWLRHKFNKHGMVLPTLILCPSIVVENWNREFKAHASPVLQEQVVLLKGDVKKRARHMLLEAGRNVFVTNYEALHNPTFVNAVKRRGIRCLVLDESHRAKNPASKLAKTLIQLADTMSYKIILTGTPVLNSQLDLWSQLRILGANIVPQNFYTFRAKYFYDANARMPKHVYFPKWVVKPTADEDLQRILSASAFTAKKSEALDLPPLLKQTVSVPLTDKQRRVYDDMERDFFATFENEGRCVTTTVVTKLLRLQQICSGVFPIETQDKERRVVLLPAEKLNALSEILEGIPREHKVIIWTHWTDTLAPIESVVKTYGDYVMLTGQTPQAEREEAIRRFNEDERCRIFIGNQAAGGIGINLTAASYMIYYSKTHNLEHDIQSEARSHRGGSERHESVTRIDIVTENTIEEEIDACLTRKQKIGERLLDWQKKRSASTTSSSESIDLALSEPSTRQRKAG